MVKNSEKVSDPEDLINERLRLMRIGITVSERSGYIWESTLTLEENYAFLLSHLQVLPDERKISKTEYSGIWNMRQR